MPKAKAANLRHKVKQLTERDSISVSLGEKLRKVNSITSGWANYYRYCVALAVYLSISTGISSASVLLAS
ncbi:group II intron maturase-specific domain-containing protein [Rhizobium beringeri]|uniref:group II intron maturase-specific domain-containing protein n=1 Tax=Rhizobium beringeri TaxID=3019934 RepID=UPI003B5BA7D9